MAPHISNDTKFAMPSAEHDKAATYRAQAMRMFGSCEAPAVVYKGVTYPKRSF